MNEAQLYEILKIHIIMYNILELEKNAKQGKTLRFQKMSFSDDSDSVTLIVNDTFVDRKVKKTCSKFSDDRVSKYMQQRQLKVRNFTTIEIVEEYNFDFRTDDLIHPATASMEAKVI